MFNISKKNILREICATFYSAGRLGSKKRNFFRIEPADGKFQKSRSIDAAKVAA